MLKRLATQWPLVSFYGLALAIVIGVMAVAVPWMLRDPEVANMMGDLFSYIEEQETYGNLISIGSFILNRHPAALLIFLFAAAPTLAAIVISLIGGGRAGLSHLLDRFRPWRDGVNRREGLRVYGWMAAIYLAVAAVYLWIAAVWGEPGGFEGVWAVLGGTPIAAFFTLLLGAFIDEGGTLEELGWRGFALPLLLDRLRNPLTATLVLGTMWWAWHLPREVSNLMGGAEFADFAVGQFKFLVTCLALSVVITYVFNKTGGSVWSGILIHGGTNVWSKALSGPVNPLLGEDLRTIVALVIALVILVLTRQELGRRP